MRNRYFAIALSALLLAVGTPPGVASGGENHKSDATLMKIVAEKRRVSLDTLRTWKGVRKRTVTEFTPKGEASVLIESNMHFAFDADRKATRWNSETTFYGTGAGGADVRSIDGVLRMDGKYCWLSANPEHLRRECIIRSDDGAREPLGTGFEIIDQFDRDRDDLFKVYEVHKRHLQDENSGAFLRRKGNLIIRGMNGPNGFLNQWTYDLDKGGNVVEFIGKYISGNPERLAEEVREMDYALQGGTWVPTKMSRKNFREGVLVQEEDIIFSNENVNEPLDESNFTLESIGLRPGDGVSDQRTGLDYIYDGSTADDTFVGGLKLAKGIEAVLDSPDLSEEEMSQPGKELEAPAMSEQLAKDSDLNTLQEKRPERAERVFSGALLTFVVIFFVILLVLMGFLFLRKRGGGRNVSHN